MSEPIGKGTKRGKDLAERVEKIVGLERQKRGLAGQLKELKGQIVDEVKRAESCGYNGECIEAVVNEMLMEDAEREEQYEFEFTRTAELETYRHALGLLDEDGRPSPRPVIPSEAMAAGAVAL